MHNRRLLSQLTHLVVSESIQKAAKFRLLLEGTLVH